MAGPSLALSFPPGLLDTALAVWQASVRQTGRISKLHEQVSQTLWSLGVPHTNEHITLDGLFCVDIGLQDTQVGMLGIVHSIAAVPPCSHPCWIAVMLTKPMMG